MKLLGKILLAFIMAFGFAFTTVNTTMAAEEGIEATEAIDTVDAKAGALNPAYVDFPSAMEVGKKYKLTVRTDYIGELEGDPKFFLLIGDGKVESVKTTYSRTKKYYTTTGYFTPKAEGSYILLFGIKQKNSSGEILEGNLEKGFKTVDKNKINLTLSPNEITAKLGEEIPVLVTYNSNITTKLEFNQNVQELGSSRKNGIYRKVYLWKPEKAGEYTLKVKAIQSRTGREEAKEITIVVE